MTQKIDTNLLKRVPLFEGLSRSDLKAVLKETNAETFPAGRVIVKEGSAGGRFFLIIEGLAKVSINGRTRTTLGPGDFFGEMSLIDRSPRSATVTAETGVQALSLASWNLLALLEEHWALTHKVLKVLAARIRELDRDASI
ncbi:MAG TPA: cyclic nucleotide-binding domain-containing protein [Actinomycetota bacterium]|nr:cyclic nucleotide-binding domain-containing protein [Actinomycetota bacterium]